MVTDARTATNTALRPMPIDPRLITLTQWLSPAYPIGAFAFSHGLENAIAEGWVDDATSLQEWLGDLLTHGSARSDASFLIRATREELAPLNREARAFSASAERLREAAWQGAAFAKITREVWGLTLPDMLLPVALGAAAWQTDMDAQVVTALYLHSFASNLCSAAQRLLPLGQTEAQRVLNALTPICMQVAAELAEDATSWSVTWASDIASMRHETLETRLFRS